MIVVQKLITVCNNSCLCCFDLLEVPDVQERLQLEIDPNKIMLGSHNVFALL